MYVPESFHETDQDKLVHFIKRYPFATLITPDRDTMAVSHVPLVVRWRDARLVLAGHVARANEH